MNLKKLLKQALCEHDFGVQYLDVKFTVDRDDMVNHWVCRCKKCGKYTRVEARRRMVL